MLMKRGLQSLATRGTLKTGTPLLNPTVTRPGQGTYPPSSGVPRGLNSFRNFGTANTAEGNNQSAAGLNMGRATLGGVGAFLGQSALGTAANIGSSGSMSVNMSNANPNPLPQGPVNTALAQSNITQNIGGRPLNVGTVGSTPRNLTGPSAPQIQTSSSKVPSHLLQGKADEALELAASNLQKNNAVWRPSDADLQSDLFKELVGDAKYTKKGKPIGTILDSTGAGNVEIKTGKSTLSSSYQQRLQTYYSRSTNTPYTVKTNRPINPTFKEYLDNNGVKIEPLSSTGGSTGGSGKSVVQNTTNAASTSTAKNTANALDTTVDGVKASTAKNTANVLDTTMDGVKASTAKNTANALDATMDGVKASTVTNTTADIAGDALKSGARSGWGTAAKVGGKALGVVGTVMDAKELYDSYQADGGKVGEQTVTSAGGIAGSWGGAAAGAKLGAMGGAALGSVIPVVGTAVGGIVGGILGGIVGGIGGNWFGKKVANTAYNEVNGGK